MKTIFIIRHAKSSWSDPISSDFDRTLNTRGIKDAGDMSQRLLKRNIPIDAIVSSPAVRAKTTANFFAETLNKGEITFISELYHAPLKTWWEVIYTLNNQNNSVAIFGHNPGITELANELTEIRIDNMPTCAIFAVTADCTTWKEFKSTKKQFLFFDYPKLGG